MAMTINEIQAVLDEKGLPAAVRVLVRVYMDAPVNDPYSGFWSPFAGASVHVARWTLGHDKDGNKRFDPKSVTDPRFKKLVWQLIPPGGTVEALVMTLAESATLELSRILLMEEIIAEDMGFLQLLDEDARREEIELHKTMTMEEKEVIATLG
tara:strand:- start:169 stop:627 length:459 start_codon:yes stop_codon:yes gene_type:complete